MEEKLPRIFADATDQYGLFVISMASAKIGGEFTLVAEMKTKAE
jgi:hypothetical protein